MHIILNECIIQPDALGHVQSPVCDIISEPGVAGKTLGEERVVALVGGTVFHQAVRAGRKNVLYISNMSNVFFSALTSQGRCTICKSRILKVVYSLCIT